MRMLNRLVDLDIVLHPEKYMETQEETDIKDEEEAYIFPVVNKASSVYSPLYIKEVISFFKPLEELVLSFALKEEIIRDKETIFVGAALGDMFGSPYEFIKSEFLDAASLRSLSLRSPGAWTDDTIMSWATYKAIEKIKSYPRTLTDQEKLMIFSMTYRDYARQFPTAGYGGGFYDWAVMHIDREEYISCGDGSAMRAGIIGAIADSISECISLAALSALPTHAHPEGIKGAVTAAVCTFVASHGGTKDQICQAALVIYPSGARTEDEYISMCEQAYIAPDLTLEEISSMQPKTMSALCNVTVPVSISLFLASTSLNEFYSLIQNIALDADTAGAIGGSIAAAFYGGHPIPEQYEDKVIQLVEGSPFRSWFWRVRNYHEEYKSLAVRDDLAWLYH